MNERPAAGLAATGLVIPLVLLCCLGPTAIASLLAGLIAWLGGLGSVSVAVVTVAVGLLAFGLLRRRSARLRRGERP
jgi:hypothetical protein